MTDTLGYGDFRDAIRLVVRSTPNGERIAKILTNENLEPGFLGRDRKFDDDNLYMISVYGDPWRPMYEATVKALYEACETLRAVLSTGQISGTGVCIVKPADGRPVQPNGRHPISPDEWREYYIDLLGQWDGEAESQLIRPGRARQERRFPAIRAVRISLDQLQLALKNGSADEPLAQDDPKARYKTGGPGKPSAIQFVEREAERRRGAGEALPTLKAEAQALHLWCKVAHPDIAAPREKTIRNRADINKGHRAYRASKESAHN